MLPSGAYESKTTEEEILNSWLSNKYFKPEYDPIKDIVLSTHEMQNDSREPFCIICPPPNAYARPHVGNLSGYAYQDAMGRYARMQGKKVLLMPGKDHAGLEGEGVFIRDVLEPQKIYKFSLKREEFYKMIWEFNMKNKEIALKDEQTIGLSADFDRDIFTLDPRIVNTVLSTFVEMYDKNLIYKGIRIVNWDPKARSAVADNQTEYKDSIGTFVYFKYGFLQPEEKALSLKKEYEDKIINWKIKNKFHGEDVKNRNEENNNQQNYLIGEDEKKTKIIGIGYQGKVNNNQLTGKVVGIQMALNKEFKVVVVNPDFTGDLKTEVNNIFLNLKNIIPGFHIILFKDYTENRFYNNGFIIGTVRIETIFADVAIAFNPEDEKYKEYFGKKLDFKSLNSNISLNIISDYSVDKYFGTGSLKITPAHSIEDWDIAQRHPAECLPAKQVIGFDLKLNHLSGKYEGLKLKEARELILKDMIDEGMIIYTDNTYQNRVKVSERTGAEIEPLLSSQWYIAINSLRQPVIDMVKNKNNDNTVNIHPENMQSKFFFWMENLRDWAISRSLWWGYRLPVWYSGAIQEKIDENGEVKTYISLVNQDPILLDPFNKDHIKVQINQPEAIQIDILRHAQTWTNKEGRYVGIKLNPEITQEGREMTENLAKTLKIQNYDLIITSPLKRTMETSKIISEIINVPIQTDALLIERNFGELDGLTWTEFCNKFPEISVKNNENFQDYLPCGEKISQVEGRVKEFIQNLKSKFKNKKILVVTHGGLIRIFKRELLNQSIEETRSKDISNLSITNCFIKNDKWIQDENVLDTWFSSGQWPYATLMAHNLMDTFYPTNVMDTGYDILENWVSRMMMFSYFKLNKKPFSDVYLNGLVKGTDGQKMSKSKKNTIPLDDAKEKFGVDSLRMAYFYQNNAGASYSLTFDKLKNFKNFNNKIWNASKFVLMNLVEIEKENYFEEISKCNNIKDFKEALNISSFKFINEEDHLMIEKIENLENKYHDLFNKFKFGIITDELYNEFWRHFCDIYIEKVKSRIKSVEEINNDSSKVASVILYYCLKSYLKMLHPFIPFITEKIWQYIPKNSIEHRSIMYSKWK